ncbi:MAG TPA: UDPGP type 1 family protein [Mollicutes bacterium]|nr:UDPGP type 1 family protein [Mollicutes bacterium]
MYNDVLSKLKKYNQEHLLRFYDELNDAEKKHLLDQINTIDFEQMNELYKSINRKEEIAEITAMSSYENKDEYYDAGIESMKRNEYAVLTMAGGQGTRLGHSGPKGTYFLEYGINKSLFEIQCDKLKHIYEISNVYTPWFIMTSNENNNATIEFFEANNYFGYPKDKISFFTQDELPMIDTNGKIVMDSKYNIKMGANGHGGVASSLHNSGILEKMKEQGIKYVFIGGIDNVLTPCDFPNFLGFAKHHNFPCASYIIPKGYPEEKVGVFCKKNGRPAVVEYIHMTPEMNNLRDEDGNLVYGDAHLLINLFTIEALEKIIDKKLKYVAAFKKTEYINDLGELIVPDKENAYKFESFIFDAFPYFDNIGLLKGKREEIFAPIKNAIGVDSPETASKLYLDFYRK